MRITHEQEQVLRAAAAMYPKSFMLQGSHRKLCWLYRLEPAGLLTLDVDRWNTIVTLTEKGRAWVAKREPLLAADLLDTLARKATAIRAANDEATTLLAATPDGPQRTALARRRLSRVSELLTLRDRLTAELIEDLAS